MPSSKSNHSFKKKKLIFGLAGNHISTSSYIIFRGLEEWGCHRVRFGPFDGALTDLVNKHSWLAGKAGPFESIYGPYWKWYFFCQAAIYIRKYHRGRPELGEKSTVIFARKSAWFQNHTSRTAGWKPPGSLTKFSATTVPASTCKWS